MERADVSRRSVRVLTALRSDGAMASRQRSESRHDGPRTCCLDRLPELSAPTLFVHGIDDPLLPADRSERAAERTGGSPELFEGCGH